VPAVEGQELAAAKQLRKNSVCWLAVRLLIPAECGPKRRLPVHSDHVCEAVDLPERKERLAVPELKKK